MYGATRDAGFGAEVKRRDPARHLRALGRLLRRVLPQGAEGPHAHPARLRRRPSARWTSSAPRRRPTPAFRLGEKADDPLAMYLSDVYTLPGEPRRRARDERARARRRGAGCPWACRCGPPARRGTMLAVAAAWEARSPARGAPPSPTAPEIARWTSAAPAWPALFEACGSTLLLPLLALRRGRRTTGSTRCFAGPTRTATSRRALVARRRRRGAGPRRAWRATRPSGG